MRVRIQPRKPRLGHPGRPEILAEVLVPTVEALDQVVALDPTEVNLGKAAALVGMRKIRLTPGQI